MNIHGITEDLNYWWKDPGERRYKGFTPRDLQRSILKRIQNLTDRRSIVLLGMRQVGKTVLLRQVAEDLLELGWPSGNLTYFDFSDDRLTTDLSPRDVLGVEPGGMDPARPRIFLLDEIGRCPKWADWLKRMVDTTPDRFLVTDSSATILRHGGIDSGQGRWDELRMETLSFREFLRLRGIDPDDAFKRAPDPFALYLAKSGFPEHLGNDDFPQVRDRLRADIVDRAILRDLLRHGVDVDQVRRLFVYLAQDSGAIFSVRNRAADLGGVDGRSLRNWVRLLDDAMLVQQLPLHPSKSAKAGSRLRAQPKIYASDHGMVVSFSTMSRPLGDSILRGRVYETMVFRQLREARSAHRVAISYFRRNDDLEADFILERSEGCLAIEVTASLDAVADKIRKLKAVGDETRADSLLLIHGGDALEWRDRLCVVPIQRFLLDPAPFLEIKR